MTLFSMVFLAFGAAAISYALTPATRRLALRLGAVDRPGPRKVHEAPIPRLGGLAVVAAVVTGSGVLCFLHARGIHTLSDPSCAGLGLGLLPILVVSLWDDIRPLPALPKFAAQFAGAGIAVAFGIRLGPQIHLFGHEITLGFFAVPLALLWIVGVTNAFNIVDGLDGLSAGLALISALSLVLVSLLTTRYAMASASLVVAGALVGFLPYNLYPAKVFLGDTGAAAVGFWLACLALRGGSTLSAGMAVLIP
ncbi:MAG: glycosyltransferase family 4 protein, partial [Thermoanaerobaculia bacterium]